MHPIHSEPSHPVPLAPVTERTFRFEVALRHSIGAITLDAEFILTKPWTVLFAPSGAGKTTILRMIAGLDRPRYARIVAHHTRPPFSESPVVLSDTKEGIHIPPWRRNVWMVAQKPNLFPHMSVWRNATFRGMHGAYDKAEWQPEKDYVEHTLRMCRVWELRDRMPHQLSGGEQQRVALARSLGSQGGHILMLDEPFTGMDEVLRAELIAELKQWQVERCLPILHVTHDVGEAFEIDAEVMRLESGRIVATGPAAVVLAEERARLISVLG